MDSCSFGKLRGKDFKVLFLEAYDSKVVDGPSASECLVFQSFRQANKIAPFSLDGLEGVLLCDLHWPGITHSVTQDSFELQTLLLHPSVLDSAHLPPRPAF